MSLSWETPRITVAARTITAESVDFTNGTQGYYFYIWGKSLLEDVEPRRVDFNTESGTTGTIELDFPVTSYYFTLAVTEGEAGDTSDGNDILKDAIFVGYANADLTYTNTVQFYLSDTNLSANGSVDISMYLDNTWTDSEVDDLNLYYTVNYGLYYIKSDKIISCYEPCDISGAMSKSVAYHTSTLASVPAGVYNFTVNIQKRTGGNTYSYSDRIVVSPNRSISTSLSIPNIVERIPSAPTSFKGAHSMAPCIYYTYDGDTGISNRLKNDDAAVDIDDYNVNGYGLILSWTDTSNNETGFKLSLANISKIKNTESGVKEAVENLPDTMTDLAWRMLVGSYGDSPEYVTVLDEDTYENSPLYVAGSLGRNSTALVLYVPFGSCYIARIQSVNNAGESEACYITLGDNFSVIDEKDTDYINGAVYEGTAFSVSGVASKVINRYKIVYYLCGGEFAYYHNGSYFEETPDYIIKYHTYGEGEIYCPITKRSEATRNSKSLIYNAVNFESYYKTWYEKETKASVGDRWRRWKMDSPFGNDLIAAHGGATVAVDETYSYQKPNDYTGYTSLYLFARYDLED